MHRVILALWALLWHLGLPLVVGYLSLRGVKEPLYIKHLNERFGFGPPVPHGAIWIHAVSLGETRAAGPLVTALLDRGETIVITNITAAGRAEAQKLFAGPIADGRVFLRWCPMELPWAIRRFLRHARPKFGMIMEIELWPQLIAQTKRMGVPLVMAQAQYPDKSFARDQKSWGRLRARSVAMFDMILAKSDRHGDRFRHFGGGDVRVTGELRFEQPIPQNHLDAAQALLGQIDPARPRLCLASTAPDEDAMLIPVVTALRDRAVAAGAPKPFFIYVPRHPKDFAKTAARLAAAGLDMVHRSTALDADLAAHAPLPPECDGMFGDSLGEIYFYYALAQRVFVGDSFNDEGSHNIIEPLRLMNPVAVGPSIWGIEYPGLEALTAKVLTKLDTPDDLTTHWAAPMGDDQTAMITGFLAQHGAATDRIIECLRNKRLL